MDRPLTRVAVLGSTGSIGCQTLDVIRAHPGRFQVTGLTAWSNVDLLAKQVGEFKPRLVACLDHAALAGRLSSPPASASLAEIACDPEVDIVVAGVVGRQGLEPVLQALECGKTVALANKEAMVMAGPLLRAAAEQGGGSIRPVDSEHSAIWQCLAGEDPSRVRRLVLTASGGALRDYPLAALAGVTTDQVLAHPTWQMGRKITVDSATLVNKGLEVIEARWLFDVAFDRIEVVMHRESIVHSLVELTDGSVKAQLSCPDMRLPIQYALCYPERPALAADPLDFERLGALHFEALDLERYPCLSLALGAGVRGGTYPAALAAADEEAVRAFLDGRIRFLDISALLADTLQHYAGDDDVSLEAVLEADAWGRKFASAWIEGR